jgi:3-deoxy-7-phosphoheptulonate synthase
MLNPARPDWSPDSWRSKPAAQQPVYPSDSTLDNALRKLRVLPPLVTPGEVEALRAQLADAAAGRKFLLQGGDCAESFDDCTAPAIVNRIKVLLQMSLVLVHGSEKPGHSGGPIRWPVCEAPLVRYRDPRRSVAARVSGRYRQPQGLRRKRTHTRPRTHAARLRTLRVDLNYTRAWYEAASRTCTIPRNWNIGFIQKAELAKEYGHILDSVSHALRFMENVLGVHAEAMQHVDLYTSHEGLHLGL